MHLNRCNSFVDSLCSLNWILPKILHKLKQNFLNRHTQDGLLEIKLHNKHITHQILPRKSRNI